MPVQARSDPALPKKRRANYSPREVLRRQVILPWQSPDLQKVHLLRTVCLLAVADTGPGRSKLDVTALQDFDIAHRIAAIVAFVSTAYLYFMVYQLTVRARRQPHKRRSRTRDVHEFQSQSAARRDLR